MVERVFALGLAPSTSVRSWTEQPVSNGGHLTCFEWRQEIKETPRVRGKICRYSSVEGSYGRRDRPKHARQGVCSCQGT